MAMLNKYRNEYSYANSIKLLRNVLPESQRMFISLKYIYI